MDHSGHRFETTLHKEFASREEVLNHLNCQYDEPMKYLELYNKQK
jgi:hypothetical protein